LLKVVDVSVEELLGPRASGPLPGDAIRHAPLVLALGQREQSVADAMGRQAIMLLAIIWHQDCSITGNYVLYFPQ
jgi:hypothetical protein